MYITVIKAEYKVQERKLELYGKHEGIFDVVDVMYGKQGEATEFIIIFAGVYAGVRVWELVLSV